ncbi:HD domain-containing protein [Candidatus Curtissbacteria bacterium]|nr:HD domain-containing protein [Candidatus Curtissbacteria bacterium]
MTNSPTNLNLKKLLDFVQKSEKLKTLLRHSWLSSGRQESVAEHSWRIALMAILLKDYLKIKINLEKVLAMIIVHDLPEIFAGDHHAWKGRLKNKFALEKKGLNKLLKTLPPKQKTKIFNLWREYEDKKTAEAKFAKALDKLETIDQHNLADLKTWVKEEYGYNLVHGKEEVKFDKVLQDLKKLIDKQTEMKVKKGK